MGEWDLYCFICGAGFSTYDLTRPPDDEEQDHDENAEDTESSSHRENDRGAVEQDPTDHPKLLARPLAHDTVGWIEVLRIIGENPKARGIKRCYMSGIGGTDMYGSVEVNKGDDPNAPEPENRDNGRLNINCYHDPETDSETAPLPAHDICLQIMIKAFETERAAGASTQIDWDMFLESVACKREDYYCALKVDYGDVWEVGEQYWGITSGEEACIH